MKNISGLIFIFYILVLLFWQKQSDQPKIFGKYPAPTEYIDKKSKRKDFKKERKEYIKNIHRSHPDDDWKAIDRKNRKLQTDKIRQKRRVLFLNTDRDASFRQIENIHRDLNGFWQEKGSNNLSGRIHTSEIDWVNNLIYCGSSGGNIWRGTIDGEEWTSLTDYLQINGILMLRLIEFENTRRLLIGSNGNFFYTDNDGATLEQSTGLDFLLDWGYIKRTIVKQSDQSIYVLANEWDYSAWQEVGSIYKSTDYGVSFEKILTFNQSDGFINILGASHFDIWTPRYFNDDVYILNNESFYRLNEFNELEFISNLPTSNSNENILTGGNSQNSVFIYAHVGDQIYYSINGGETWADRGTRPQWPFMINSFNSSNINRDEIYWGGIEAFRSNNSANSWSLVNNWWEYYGSEDNKLHADIPEIRFFLDEEYSESIALISTDGGLYRSTDRLESVQNLSLNGLGVSQYYSTYTKRTEPYNLYAGSQDQGFQRSLNPSEGILNFEQSISGDYGHIVSGDDGETLWTNYPGFTMYYANPETDTNGETLNFPGSGHLWLAPLMEDPYYPNKAYLGGGGLSGGHHLFHLTANQWSISYEEHPYSFNSKISAMSYSPIEPSYRYVLTYNGSFYYSINDGGDWEISNSFDGPDAHYFYGSTIWSSQNNLGLVIIGGSGYSNPPVYISYDHGQSFQPFDEGLPNTLVYKIVGTQDENYYFAATELGPYVYISDEGVWEYLGGISAPDQVYWTVEYIEELNTARFGTYGRGIWDFVMESSSFILGDLNFDELLNIQDVILLVNIVLGSIDPETNQFNAGDMNEDGLLNILDIIDLVNNILG